MKAPVTAKDFFEAALEKTDAERNPAMWNLVAGLIKLSEALQRIESHGHALERKIGGLESDVRRLKH